MKYAAATIILLMEFSLCQIDYGFNFSKSGSAGFQFLMIEADAISAGLSGASSTIKGGSKNSFVNVSSITGTNQFSTSISNVNWFAGSNLNSASLSFRKGSNVFGLGILSFNISEFEETTVSSPTGTGRQVSAGNNLLCFTVARNFTDRLSLGSSIKYVEELLDDYAYNNIMFDIGSFYETGFRNFSLAFVFQHLGPDVTPINTKFRSPMLFRLGASDNLYANNLFKAKLLFELIHPTDDEDYFIIAQEISILDKLFFRYGNKIGNKQFGNSIGLGINDFETFNGLKISIDYSIIFMDYIFDNINIISVSLNR